MDGAKAAMRVADQGGRLVQAVELVDLAAPLKRIQPVECFGHPWHRDRILACGPPKPKPACAARATRVRRASRAAGRASRASARAARSRRASRARAATRRSENPPPAPGW